MIGALDRKLFRDLRRIWAQGIAIALVLACGIATLMVAFGSVHTLTESRAAYYERNRFADIFAGATRVPGALAEEIALIDGVAVVEPRIAATVVLDMPEMRAPAMARVVSLPADGAPLLNLPLVRQGRLPLPDRADEVGVSEPFAVAHGLQPGDSFVALLGGQRRELTVTGTLLSPEFIYTLGPATLFPDDRRFGILWMGEAAAAAAFDLSGAFNDVLIGLTRDARPEAVMAAVDTLLEPYGGTGAHGRDRQTSHAFLQQELDQLGAMALIMPPVFFVVAAFLVNLVLGRLIGTERTQIGLLKAVGYSTVAIATHYLKLAAGIGVAGCLIGWGFGIWLGGLTVDLYAEYFRFPFLIRDPATWAYAVSGTLTMATVLLGALRAIMASVRLTPAVAMSPPRPPQYARGVLDGVGRGLGLRQSSMMILRSIIRWPGRAALTFLGVAASIAVLVGSFFFFDAVELMMDETFTQANRQHVTLSLADPAGPGAVDDAAALPGVLRAEGGFAVPVRLRVGTQSRLSVIEARDPAATLSRTLDLDGQAVAVPAQGVMLPALLANRMGLSVGDRIEVEFLVPPRETHLMTVTAISQQRMGETVHMHPEALFAALRHGPRVNRIDLLVDAAQIDALYAAVKARPSIAGIALFLEVQRQFREQMDENLLTVVFIYSTLGVLITIGVVYNAARIQLSERAYELATLRVLGFSRGEVGGILVGEIMLLALLALPVGWLAGYGFAWVTATGMSTDVIAIPFVVGRQTFGFATVLVVAAALGSVLMVRRRLDRVDLVSALKQQG